MLEFKSIRHFLLGYGRMVVCVVFPIETSESDVRAFKLDEMRFMESLHERSLGCELMLYRRLTAISRLDRIVDLLWGSETMRLMGRMPTL
ncbi:MAG: hypothetical protein H6727_09275 [Myxococcales bacterium]|nr:hypothetical protein [Myxococcales bacterium]